MSKFELKKDTDGFKFRLKAGNGQVIALSQTYATKSGAQKGIRSLVRTAKAARVEDQTAPNFSVEKNPKFEVFSDGSNAFSFRLKASNGSVVANGRQYKTKSSALKGVESIRSNAPTATIVEVH